MSTTTRLTQVRGGRGSEGWGFGSLARGNALRRPTDVVVLTAGEWRALDGTAVSSAVVMHGI